MKRIVLIFGLFAGLIVSATMSIYMTMCYQDPASNLGSKSMIIGYLSMIIAFSLIYVGVKNYRDKQNGGSISFGKAFKIGFFISLVASTMYVLVWAVMYKFFMPDFMEVYTAEMMKQAAASSNGAELQARAAEMEKYKEWYKNPLFFGLITYSEILPVGIIVSLITALILKRKKPVPAMAI